jgi:hypothetical protein
MYNNTITMDILNLFLFGEDSIDDVKQIRLDALNGIAAGGIVEWSSDSVSVKKVYHFKLHDIVKECNYFLRLYDPVISAANPIIKETRPILYYT